MLEVAFFDRLKYNGQWIYLLQSNQLLKSCNMLLLSKTCLVLEFISAVIRMTNDSLALGKHEKWCTVELCWLVWIPPLCNPFIWRCAITQPHHNLKYFPWCTAIKLLFYTTENLWPLPVNGMLISSWIFHSLSNCLILCMEKADQGNMKWELHAITEHELNLCACHCIYED